MNLEIFGLALLALVVLAAAPAVVQEAPPADSAQALYAEYCASCHPVDGRCPTSLFDGVCRQGDRVIHEGIILKDMGRVREAVTGPDGAICAGFNERDEILRISSLGPVRH